MLGRASTVHTHRMLLINYQRKSGVVLSFCVAIAIAIAIAIVIDSAGTNYVRFGVKS